MKAFLWDGISQRQLFTKGWGVIKTYYVPEEDDIQNVLQTVFENY